MISTMAITHSGHCNSVPMLFMEEGIAESQCSSHLPRTVHSAKPDSKNSGFAIARLEPSGVMPTPLQHLCDSHISVLSSQLAATILLYHLSHRQSLQHRPLWRARERRERVLPAMPTESLTILESVEDMILYTS